MSMPLEFDAVPALQAVEVMGPDIDPERIRELQAVHLTHFPDHPHVADELAVACREGSFDPAVVVHQWLLLVNDEPAGEYIFHVNLRRGIALRHFLAMDQSARRQLPIRWLTAVTDRVQAIGERACRENGTALLAMMSEVSPAHLEGWRRLGYRTLDIGYREPRHGKHWAQFGEPEFFDMTPCLKLTEAGANVPIADVATAAASAFLIDHYRLPADNPTVVGVLARAAALPA